MREAAGTMIWVVGSGFEERFSFSGFLECGFYVYYGSIEEGLSWGIEIRDAWLERRLRRRERKRGSLSD